MNGNETRRSVEFPDDVRQPSNLDSALLLQVDLLLSANVSRLIGMDEMKRAIGDSVALARMILKRVVGS